MNAHEGLQFSVAKAKRRQSTGGRRVPQSPTSVCVRTRAYCSACRNRPPGGVRRGFCRAAKWVGRSFPRHSSRRSTTGATAPQRDDGIGAAAASVGTRMRHAESSMRCLMPQVPVTILHASHARVCVSRSCLRGGRAEGGAKHRHTCIDTVAIPHPPRVRPSPSSRTTTKRMSECVSTRQTVALTHHSLVVLAQLSDRCTRASLPYVHGQDGEPFLELSNSV